MVDQKGLLHLPRFRAWLFDHGRMALEKRNPQYVHAFLQGIAEGKTLEENIPETKPLLRSSIQPWQDLLEAELQLERRLERLRHSLSLLAKVPSDDLLASWGITRGAWMFYHLHYWYLVVFSFLECWEKLLKLVSRRLLTDRERDRGHIEAKLLPVPTQLRRVIKKQRDDEAHTAGGDVEALGQERLWELMLLVPGSRETLLANAYKAIVPNQKRWHDVLLQMTSMAVAYLEQSFEQLGRMLYKDA